MTELPQAIPRDGSRWSRTLRRMVRVQPGELAALLWSWLYFFSLLAGYYVLRPVRDDMGIAGGVRNLPWLYMGTASAILVTNPLFSALVSRFPRRRFIPYAYRFFELNLLIFFVALRSLPPSQQGYVARAFFIWTSVFNLFVVSVFWGFMADCFSEAQGRRLFAFLAVGGTLGAIAGSASTAFLVARLGTVNLLLITVVLLEVGVFCVGRLVRIFAPRPVSGSPAPLPIPIGSPRDPIPTRAYARRYDERPIGGGALQGILSTLRSPYLLGICGYILLFTITSTYLSFEGARIVDENFKTSPARTAFFARIDLYVNVLTVVLQALVAGRIIGAIGIGPTAAALPGLTVLAFAGLTLMPTLVMLTLVQVVRRAADYGLARPAREVLFTVVRRDEKYKAKNFIDTFVYRGGDALGGASYKLLEYLGSAASAAAALAVPMSIAWGVLALLLGRQQGQLARGWASR